MSHDTASLLYGFYNQWNSFTIKKNIIYSTRHPDFKQISVVKEPLLMTPSIDSDQPITIPGNTGFKIIIHTTITGTSNAALCQKLGISALPEGTWQDTFTLHNNGKPAGYIISFGQLEQAKAIYNENKIWRKPGVNVWWQGTNKTNPSHQVHLSYSGAKPTSDQTNWWRMD